jgi:hypothetical protein
MKKKVVTISEQSIFNRVVKGLASQGFKRSQLSSTGSCQLRYQDRKCAIGWLIPDSKYRKSMEAYASVDETRPNLYCKQVGLSKKYAPFIIMLANLQHAHDDSETPAKMKKALCQLAKDYSLKLPKALQ